MHQNSNAKKICRVSQRSKAFQKMSLIQRTRKKKGSEAVETKQH